jgi:hypothetical protein
MGGPQSTFRDHQASMMWGCAPGTLEYALYRNSDHAARGMLKLMRDGSFYMMNDDEPLNMWYGRLWWNRNYANRSDARLALKSYRKLTITSERKGVSTPEWDWRPTAIMDESIDWVTQNLSKISKLTAHNIGTGQSTTIHAEILGQGFMGVVLNPKKVDGDAMNSSLTQLRSQTGWRQFKFVSPETWNGKFGLINRNFKAESILIDYANIQAKVRGNLCELIHSHSSWLFTADSAQSKFASLEFTYCD